jgi:hypothetical protein
MLHLTSPLLETEGPDQPWCEQMSYHSGSGMLYFERASPIPNYSLLSETGTTLNVQQLLNFKSKRTLGT